jgi:hypothetical protein
VVPVESVVLDLWAQRWSETAERPHLDMRVVRRCTRP